MVKKIGKCLLSVLLLCCSSGVYAHTSVFMKLLDTNGDPITQAALSVPFVIEVIISSDKTVDATPEIHGLQHFFVENKTHVSTINSVVNGERSTKKIFRYTMRADKQGRYTIGPAQVTIDHQRIQSDKLTVIVGPQQVTRSDESCMRLLVDKDRVMIGEKISCVVRFYPGSSATLDGISEPTFPGFSAGALNGPFTGSDVIDGISRSYVEWRTTLYPTKIGSLTIPACAAICKIKRKQRNYFDIFDHWFDGGFDQKQVFSNALTITVDALPPYNGHVHGIGLFTKLLAEREPAIAKEGEGIVYRLVLEGEGNLDSVEPLELTLPKSLKYYESKQYIQDDTQRMPRKIFEYIVQGIEPGSWVIPSQVFIYFDVYDHSYKQLQSNELQVTIQPLGVHHSGSASEKKEHDQKVPVLYDGQWQLVHEHSIPWLLFFVVLCLPVLFMVLWFTWISWHTYRKKYAHTINAKKAFTVARSILKHTQQDADVTQLYDLFVVLIAHRRMIDPTHVSAEYCIDLVQNCGWSTEMVVRWQSFFDALLQSKFGSVIYDETKRRALCNASLYWIDELQKIL